MRIYLYHKLDRGFYELAYSHWRKQGGDIYQHLLKTQHSLQTWTQEWTQQGHTVRVDLRSSFLLPPERRQHLPLSLVKALRAILWVTRADPWLLQQDLLRRIEHFKPDIVFFPLGSSIWASTLRTLRERGVRLVLWCGLPAGTMLQRDRATLPFFDLIFQPANFAEGLRAAGATARIEYLPIGIDPTIHRPMRLTSAEQDHYGSDVCFIGGLGTQFHKARREMVEYALRQGVNMKVWGGYREHFIGSPILSAWQGQIWGEDQVKALCATKVGLNFHLDHQPGELDQGLNVRAFELPACGVFQLLHRVPGIANFYEEGREVVCFTSKEEMLDKIRYYLAHPTERQQIAEAGYQRVLRDHTWASRIQRMLVLLHEIV